MKILVHEFVSGGGFSGREIPAGLAREGAAMLGALLSDLAAVRRHQIVATADPRFPLSVPSGVEVVMLPPGDAGRLDALMATADAIWLVAPETDRCLERLAERAERTGIALLGPSAAAIRRASDKAALPRRLARLGVRHPKTHILGPAEDWKATPRTVDYPVVIKPARGAGCAGVRLARNARELHLAMSMARRASGKGAVLVQEYVNGAAASVSLLSDGRRAVPLAVNAQFVEASRDFVYRGGATPLEHPLAARAVEAALRTCEAIAGLRGYVGVDVVLTESEAVVIEVNPRLTTAYLGVRSAIEENIAEMALAACAGDLPTSRPVHRRVRFTASGRITLSARLRAGSGRRRLVTPRPKTVPRFSIPSAR